MNIVDFVEECKVILYKIFNDFKRLYAMEDRL